MEGPGPLAPSAPDGGGGSGLFADGRGLATPRSIAQAQGLLPPPGPRSALSYRGMKSAFESPRRAKRRPAPSPYMRPSPVKGSPSPIRFPASPPGFTLHSARSGLDTGSPMCSPCPDSPSRRLGPAFAMANSPLRNKGALGRPPPFAVIQAPAPCPMQAPPPPLPAPRPQALSRDAAMDLFRELLRSLLKDSIESATQIAEALSRVVGSSSELELTSDDVRIVGACITFIHGHIGPTYQSPVDPPRPRLLFRHILASLRRSTGLFQAPVATQDKLLARVFELFPNVASSPHVLGTSHPAQLNLTRRMAESKAQFELLSRVFAQSTELFHHLVAANAASCPFLNHAAPTGGPKCGTLRETHFAEIKRYAWILYLTARDALATNFQPDNEQSVMVACVMFAFMQMSDTNLAKVPDTVGSNASSIEAVRIQWYLSLKRCLQEKFGFTDGLYAECEQRILPKIMADILHKQVHGSNLLGFHGVDRSTPIPVFLGCFDLGRQGWFYTNIKVLEDEFASSLLQCETEWDWRIICGEPKWMGMTPGARTGTTGAAPLKSSIATQDQMSTTAPVFSHLIPALPVLDRQSYTKGVNLTEIHKERMIFRQKLAGLDSNPATHFAPHLSHDSMTATETLDTIRERVTRVFDVMVKRDARHRDTWMLGIKTYYLYAKMILRFFKNRATHTEVGVLLDDGQFHRCLLLCAFESIRCIFLNPEEMRSHKGMNQTMGAHNVELTMVIEILLMSQSSIPPMAQKRLRIIEDQIMERELWGGPALYQTIDKAKGLIDPSDTPISTTSLFYQDLACPSSSPSQDPLKYCRALLDAVKAKMGRMCYTRLQCIIQELTGATLVGMEEARVREVFDQAWWLMGYIITLELGYANPNSSRHKFFYKRHVDVILICALYASASYHGVKLTMKEIVRAYSQMPQFTESTLQNIHFISTVASPSPGPENSHTGMAMTPFEGTESISKESSETVSLIGFYNLFMVPVLRKLLKVKESNKSAQMPADAISPHTPMLITPMIHRRQHELVNRCAMTPMTKRLTNMDETSSPRHALPRPPPTTPIQPSMPHGQYGMLWSRQPMRKPPPL